jgi:hypothetical protein
MWSWNKQRPYWCPRTSMYCLYILIRRSCARVYNYCVNSSPTQHFRSDMLICVVYLASVRSERVDITHIKVADGVQYVNWHTTLKSLMSVCMVKPHDLAATNDNGKPPNNSTHHALSHYSIHHVWMMISAVTIIPTYFSYSFSLSPSL